MPFEKLVPDVMDECYLESIPTSRISSMEERSCDIITFIQTAVVIQITVVIPVLSIQSLLLKHGETKVWLIMGSLQFLL